MTDFKAWFSDFTGCPAPHGWQARLALDAEPRSRALRVPTGLGKTAGTISAWAWNRLVRRDDAWPRRLVFCLPMRVLVEQTESEVRRWLERADLLWRGPAEPRTGRVGVHRLMGGVDLDEWHLWPDEPAVLIGTQDMLLSRALNRGYGSPRARWPMEMAPLHQDALWVLDEVQLMDVGLLTSVQVQSFRDDEAARALRPAYSWWMSATMQDEWLRTSIDFRPRVDALARTAVEPAERNGVLWEVRKSLSVQEIPRSADVKHRDLAQCVLDAHRATNGGLTLVIVNTVDAAIETFDAIEKRSGGAVALQLIHSRFRGIERSRWTEFLHRDACSPGVDRILVATQVVEAGVDISADALVTEMAPWTSLVQRIGRCARYGGTGHVIVVDRLPTDEKATLPYRLGDLVEAGKAIREIDRVDPAALEAFESALVPERRARLYPYDPLYVLTRRDFDDLFDTSPDLTGADVDVSRFIRTGEERDVSLWWWTIGKDEKPAPDLQPRREELCAVPVGRVRDWIKPAGDDEAGQRIRAWTWDYLDDCWRTIKTGREIYPGQTILVDAACGGYDERIGFTGKPLTKGREIPLQHALREPLESAALARLRADLAQDHDDLSQAQYKTIATHGVEAAAELERLLRVLALPESLARSLSVAARAHDLGKAHPVFVAAIREKGPFEGRVDLAKAPRGAWHAPSKLYTHDRRSGPRPGFRHELASALALLELVRREDPFHGALLGPHRALLAALGEEPIPVAPSESLAGSGGFASELAALDPLAVNLVLWLVCTHHGKVRASWQATPSDQEWPGLDDRGQPLRGVRNGDEIPAIVVADASGADSPIPAITLHLDAAAIGLSRRYGASWTERVDMLLCAFGPLTLSYLETLLRVADVRASQLPTADPRLLGAVP